jgi:putative peptidoglycan lipid II flippase
VEVEFLTESISEEHNISRAAGVVGLFTFLSRILGLIRDIVLAFFFGTGMAMDAFVAAFRIPNLLRRLFAEGSLTIVFIPVFTEYLTTRTKKEAFELARIILTLLAVILVIITLLGVLFSPWLVRIQAFGFGGSGVKYDLTVLLTRITFPYIFFISIVALFMGILNSLRHFAAPAAAPIFLNVGIIGASYLISPHLAQPIVGVAVGVLIGGALQVALQIPWVLQEGLRLFPLWRLDHPAVRKIALLMAPALFGSAVYQLNSYIGTLLASFLEEGSVSWLYYADRLVQFPLGVFAIAISTAALPSFSTQVAEKKMKELEDTFSHALGLVFFIIIPSTVGLIVLGKPIIQMLFERGAFGASSSMMTSQALMMYAMGLWAFSGTRIIVSVFYAFQDTKTPVKVAVVTFLINLLLSLLLMGPLKHNGIALALSLASAIQFFLLLFILNRRFAIIRMRPSFVSAMKSVAAASIMGMGVYYAYSHWLIMDLTLGFWNRALNLAGLMILGIFLYFLGAWILRCRELVAVADSVRSLFSSQALSKG